ncbi:uncharacterized protein LAESUDRAFT_223155 [Laetiporus sulphureus 93-53]|uniref:MYND-type domain-containing protein n=1 Tax=Laetiporus sulphureus 93-53 TaxID=1314785 RepID=A0A165DTT5_9APHY|nr:uncharacterized protein LAESUDRAFT_223155 [Laetiporus sulphureus 93-53]KZT05622.1 hypothetical protein LAESUDRAFT_223155 [Laetiporus sulphureus 93-53]
MSHPCARCGNSTTLTCSACKAPTALYCSKDCQKKHWKEHSTDCKISQVIGTGPAQDVTLTPSRSLATAHKLGRAVYDNEVPEDVQTRVDYGFSRALVPANESMLIGLYTGLIKMLGISAKTIHEWRLNGILIQKIRATFEQLPLGHRGGYYPWFLENQWILDPTLSRRSVEEEIWLHAKRYANLPANLPKADMLRIVSKWPKNKRYCYQMSAMVISGFRPKPSQDLWILFGLCACPDEWSEKWLGMTYRMLSLIARPESIMHCSFSELCDAYNSSDLLSLFQRHGLKGNVSNIPHLQEVLEGSPTSFKSVWYLKQFAVSECDTVPLQQQASADYGFTNCVTNGKPDAEKKEMLRKVYREAFLKKKADPLELHEAAIKGKIFEFVSELVAIREDQQDSLKEMMKRAAPEQPQENKRSGNYNRSKENPRRPDPTVDELLLRAKGYAGLPDSVTRTEMTEILSTWPKNTVHCYLMAASILWNLHFSPSQDQWVMFGFCACPDEESEGELGDLYRSLIDSSRAHPGQRSQCSFKELCDAFNFSDLFALFERHGLKNVADRIPNLANVLEGSPTSFKTVWHLKQFAVSDRGSVQMSNAVAWDYGFVNCVKNRKKGTKPPDSELVQEAYGDFFSRTQRRGSASSRGVIPNMMSLSRVDADAVEMLRKVYQDVFLKAKADPMKLHEAAMQGRIFDFVSGIVEIRADQKQELKELMVNVYPLRDPDAA